MSVDSIVEWISHVMGIELTDEQVRVLRKSFEDSVTTDDWQPIPEWTVGEAITDEAARIPDHVFTASVEEK